MSATRTIRTLDLFAGCGGLSLGFELSSDQLQYEVALAIDNDQTAVRCYNANRPSRGLLPVARVVDLTWFSHPSEVLLFYLSHIAISTEDAHLTASLGSIGFVDFLRQVDRIDADFERRFHRLSTSESYSSEANRVDSRVFSLAICNTFLGRLGLASIRHTPAQTSVPLPWREEYRAIQGPFDAKTKIETIPDAFFVSAREFWKHELDKLADAGGRRGTGQQAVVSGRLRTLVDFLRSDAAMSLHQLWSEWRARRDSARAQFCTTSNTELQRLYVDRWQIDLVLGGPPCKGFSRIGRPVIERLRDQGSYAWTSNEYGDERNALLHKYVLFLEALQPTAFLFENVANFQSELQTPTGSLDAAALLRQTIEELSNGNVHFDVGAQIINARKSGVPQDRLRYIMVGFNRSYVPEGSPKRFFQLQEFEDVPLLAALVGLDPAQEFDYRNIDSVKTASYCRAYTVVDVRMPPGLVRFVNWIRQVDPTTTNLVEETDAHVYRRSRADDLSLIEMFAPGQRWMDYKLRRSQTLADLENLLDALIESLRREPIAGLPDLTSIQSIRSRVDGALLLRLLIEEASLPIVKEGEAHHLLNPSYLAKGHGSHGDWFERLSATKPSKTIVAHIGKDTYGFIHPYENRPLSIREAARIQSFPDFFKFGAVGVVDGYSLIGNAVPPLLARTFAERFASIDRELDFFSRSQTLSSEHSEAAAFATQRILLA